MHTHTHKTTAQNPIDIKQLMQRQNHILTAQLRECENGKKRVENALRGERVRGCDARCGASCFPSTHWVKNAREKKARKERDGEREKKIDPAREKDFH